MALGDGTNGDVPSDVELTRQRALKPGPEDEQLNDDERKRWDWKTRYEDAAWKVIRRESWYVVAVVVLALLGIFLTWHGGWITTVTSSCTLGCNPLSLRRYAFVLFSGVLGGALFGLKYLYKVVARGLWNRDRVIWRYTSPLLSGGLAFGTAVLTQAGIFGFTNDVSDAAVSFVAMGFIVGYFADEASGKMQEVAKTLFGTTAHANRDRQNLPPKDKSAPDMQ